MEVFEDKTIDEKMYIETLENGMKIKIVPKKNTKKFFIIWGTHFGSIDNHFFDPILNKEVKVPDGVAHYLEHKMFEQKSGVDALYTLMGLGLDANAYTTTDHTAYLFGGTSEFYKGLDCLMDYVQNPYFTDENVEKERGIIGQEIMMGQDQPGWKLYLNAMKCLYKDNPICKDIAGSIESISKITKEILYSCYNTFYHPSNMVMCISGDFEPEKLVDEIKKRLVPREKIGKIQRIYPKQTKEIAKKYAEEKADVSMPIFMIGYKDNIKNIDFMTKNIGMQIILNSCIGKCSECYQKLYSDGLIMREFDNEYEFSSIYSHVLIGGESKDPKKVEEVVVNEIKNHNITEEEFNRSKNRIFGEYVSTFTDPETIGKNVIYDSMNNINTLEYGNIIKNITIEKVNEIKEKLFDVKNEILSVIKKDV